MTPRNSVDIDEIKQALDLLVDPGQIVELRALEVPERGRTRTFSGYFDDMELLAQEAAGLSGRAKGVYITLNVIEPALLARRTNRVDAVGERESTTGDSHITRRRWLLIDLDGAAVSGVSTTDAEHEEAIGRARLVSTHLAELGWPAPILADSGNGAHLLYRIDLPADDGGVVKRCLEALQEQFGGDGINVDRTVHNPARISKLYGTLARKGDNTSDRPHRLARMIEVPKTVEVVPSQLLDALASTAPRQVERVAKASSGTAGASPRRGFDIGAWIEQHELDVEDAEPWQGGRIWKFRECPWNPEHRDRSAWVAQLASGAISAGCHHDGCSGKNWSALRSLYGGTEQSAEGSERKSQTELLLELVDESEVELWHTATDEAYLTIPVDDHGETYALRSRRTELWLRRLYYRATDGKAVNNHAVGDVLNVLRSKALFDGVERPVHVRIGPFNGDIYIDLGGKDWSAVRVSESGWSLVADAPVRFRRPRGMIAFPPPVRGGTLQMLRPFVNVATEDDFSLMVTALVAAYWSKGPYPIVVLNGEQGSAKSTTARVLRSLVDPNAAPIRSEPRSEHDLVIGANNGWVVALDNLSGVRPWLSDAICRLATGGGFSTRELYSDDEEVLFEAQRPVLLNGIDELSSRSDLLDRSLTFVLPSIREEDRRDEDAFWSEFERNRPLILGAILDALVLAKREIEKVQLVRLPRLADFARRGAAMAPAVGWTADGFLSTYADNRASGHSAAIESSAVGRLLQTFMQDRQQWMGTASALLEVLSAGLGDADRADRSWPKTPRGMSGGLRRIAPNLRHHGILVEFERDTARARERTITITSVGTDIEQAPSEPSVSSDDSRLSSDTGSPGPLDADGCADDRPNRGIQPSEASSLNSDDADGSDDVEQRPGNLPAAYRRCPECRHRPAPPDRLCFRCQEVAS